MSCSTNWEVIDKDKCYSLEWFLQNIPDRELKVNVLFTKSEVESRNEEHGER